MGPLREGDRRERMLRKRQRDSSIGASEEDTKQVKEDSMGNRAIFQATAGLSARLQRGPRLLGIDFRIKDRRWRLRPFMVGGPKQVGLP